jgi:hypothetical protein
MLFPQQGGYRPEHDLDRNEVYVGLLTESLAGYYGFCHFGIPCKRWSALARMTGGSKRLHAPDGVRPFTRPEAISYEQAERVAALCLATHHKEGLFSTENSFGSCLFECTPMAPLQSLVPTWSAVVDQCQFALRPPSPRGVHEEKHEVFDQFPRNQEHIVPTPAHPGHQRMHTLVSRVAVQKGERPACHRACCQRCGNRSGRGCCGGARRAGKVREANDHQVQQDSLCVELLGLGIRVGAAALSQVRNTPGFAWARIVWVPTRMDLNRPMMSVAWAAATKTSAAVGAGAAAGTMCAMASAVRS